MNHFVMSMPLSLRLAACLAIAPLAACNTAPAEAPLAGAKIGGDFELVNSKGETVRWTDFNGKYRMIYFGYAYCPDICPFDMQRMMAGYKQFAEAKPELAAQVQPIFVTIDPERDTPAVIGEFTSAFSDKLLGLTGTPEQVASAAKAFAVYYKKGDVNAEGGYLMDHSKAAFLMGRQGEPIAMLPVDLGGQQVAAELEKWVN